MKKKTRKKGLNYIASLLGGGSGKVVKEKRKRKKRLKRKK